MNTEFYQIKITDLKKTISLGRFYFTFWSRWTSRKISGDLIKY